VAGRVPKEVVRPGGTPEFRRPVRTDSVLQPPPGTWEGLRVSGHIQSRLPREPPVVDEVALRLRLPAEQALCGVALPGACA